MIQRRQFLGAATAAALCLTTQPGFSATTNSAAALTWNSQEIRTLPRGIANRTPVVTGASLQPSGNLLAIVGDDHFVSLYDIRSQQFISHLKQHTDWVRSAKFSPDSSALFTCGNDRRMIRWETSQFTKPVFNIRREKAIIEMAVSNDSKLIATVGFCNEIVIHDAETGRELTKFKCECEDNHAVAFSADDKLVAAGGRNGVIHVWDVATETLIHEVKAHRRRIRSLEFTPEGELISAGDDQIVRINRLNDIDQSISLPRQATKLFAVKTIAPSVIATSGSDNKIHIWNTERGSEIGTLEKHTGTVSCLDMAQDVLVSGSFDTTVRIWTPKPEELAVATPRFVTPQLTPNASADRSVATPNDFGTRR